MAFLEYRPAQTLFQFCSLQSFRGILASKAIWCTDLNAANDPRELKLGFQHFFEALKFVGETEYRGRVGDFLRGLASRVMSGQERQQLFCACFSLQHDSLPMWREYGDNCRGLAIGFRPTAVTSLPGRIQKVRYLDADTPEEFRSLVRNLASSFDPEHSPEDVHYWSSATSSILAAATALKHYTWRYEEEIRFGYAQVYADPGRIIPVSTFDDGTPIYWQQPLARPRGAEQVQYLAFPFGLRKRNSYKTERAIDRVLVGPRCELSVEDVRTELQDQGFVGVNVLRSECEVR
jgi:hypothetical protein